MGERFEQKTIELVVVRRRYRTAGREQRDRVRLQRLAGRVQRARLERELVGLVEQHRQNRAERFRETMRLELLDIGGDLPGLVAFALRSRECSLERVGRCGAVPAASVQHPITASGSMVILRPGM